MAPHQTYRAKLGEALDIDELHVGEHLRVLAVDRGRGEIAFEISQRTYRKLSFLDFVFGREPEQYIRVRP